MKGLVEGGCVWGGVSCFLVQHLVQKAQGHVEGFEGFRAFQQCSGPCLGGQSFVEYLQSVQGLG